MSRFLTPAKVSLLALIELYGEDAVPDGAILPTLAFIASHVIDKSSAVEHSSSSPSSPSSASSSTSPSLSQERWRKASGTISLLLSLSDIEQLLTPHAAAGAGLPGRRLWDVYLAKLWAVDSLHALHEFLDRRSQLLAKTRDELRALTESGLPATPTPTDPNRIRLAPGSPFGAFVRRALVEFRRLRFQDACDLWRAFVRYRQPTELYWRRRTAAVAAAARPARLSFDSVLLEGQHEWGAEGTSALATVAYGEGMLLPGDEAGVADDGGVAVSFDDVELLLEFQVEQMQKFGNRIPADLRGKFEELLRSSHVVPSLSHYLKFLEAWKSGDYPTSFDYLHRYFDYTMQSRDRLFYQYALMNLAVLQSEFGCHREALAAMLETVSTARENRDVGCLNFALSWLFHFGRAHPDLVSELESSSMLGSGKESLAFLRAKAKEAGNWTLWCSALLSEAKLGLSTGESIAAALELMVRSSHILVEHNMKGMLGAQLSMHTALWDRLGVGYLAQSSCEVFLRCYASHSMFDDELKLVCRLASQLALQGKYDDAFALLDGVDRDGLSSWRPGQYWQEYRNLLQLRRALHRSDLDAAGRLLSQLLQTQPDDLEPDLSFVIGALQVEYLLRRNDLPAASARLEHLLSNARVHARDVSIRVRLLLLKAHLFDRAGRPQQGFTLCMRAAGLAWRARIMPALWQAVGALANVLTALGEFDAAARVLQAVVPRFLECGSAHTAGQLYSYLADAYVGMAGLGGGGGARAGRAARRTEYLVKAQGALDQASAHFAAVEDVERQCEVVAKKATILRAAGDAVLANDCAAKYLVLRKQAGLLVS